MTRSWTVRECVSSSCLPSTVFDTLNTEGKFWEIWWQQILWEPDDKISVQELEARAFARQHQFCMLPCSGDQGLINNMEYRVGRCLPCVFLSTWRHCMAPPRSPRVSPFKTKYDKQLKQRLQNKASAPGYWPSQSGQLCKCSFCLFHSTALLLCFSVMGTMSILVVMQECYTFT